MRSIIQEPDHRCYFCQLLGDYSEKVVEVHHAIFGTSGRKLSEKYGLKVYLCPYHHRTGKASVHQNAKLAAYVKDIAQRRFEEFHTDEDFYLIFGKNYRLESEEIHEALEILRGK